MPFTPDKASGGFVPDSQPQAQPASGWQSPGSQFPPPAFKLKAPTEYASDAILGGLGDIFKGILSPNETAPSDAGYDPSQDETTYHGAGAGRSDYMGRLAGEAPKAVESTANMYFAGKFPKATVGLSTLNQTLAAPVVSAPISAFHALRDTVLPFLKPDKNDSDLMAAFKQGLNTVMDVKALEHAPAVLNKGKELLKSGGEAAYRGAITPNNRESELMQNYQAGRTPAPPITRATTGLNRGLVGTEGMIGKQAAQKGDQLWKEIKTSVQSIPGKIPYEEFRAQLETRIKSQPLVNQGEMWKGLGKLDEIYSGKQFTLEQWQTEKAGMYKFTPQAMFRGEDVSNGFNQMKFELASGVREKTWNLLPEEGGIRQKYLDWGNLKETEQVGVKAGSQAAFQGGKGKFDFGVIKKVATPVLTTAGQVLKFAGDTLGAIGNAIKQKVPADVQNKIVDLTNMSKFLETTKTKKFLTDKVDQGMYTRDFNTQAAEIKSLIKQKSKDGNVSVNDVVDIATELMSKGGERPSAHTIEVKNNIINYLMTTVDKTTGGTLRSFIQPPKSRDAFTSQQGGVQEPQGGPISKLRSDPNSRLVKMKSDAPPQVSPQNAVEKYYPVNDQTQTSVQGDRSISFTMKDSAPKFGGLLEGPKGEAQKMLPPAGGTHVENIIKLIERHDVVQLRDMGYGYLIEQFPSLFSTKSLNKTSGATLYSKKSK